MWKTWQLLNSQNSEILQLHKWSLNILLSAWVHLNFWSSTSRERGAMDHDTEMHLITTLQEVFWKFLWVIPQLSSHELKPTSLNHPLKLTIGLKFSSDNFSEAWISTTLTKILEVFHSKWEFWSTIKPLIRMKSSIEFHWKSESEAKKFWSMKCSRG